MYMNCMSEPVSDPESGIYLGRTAIYKLPFYLDSSALLNQHMTIIGMSGSGKSYALKSILTKSSIRFNTRILVVDWNNEYNEIMDFLSGRILSLGLDFRVNILEMYPCDPTGISDMVAMIDGFVKLDDGQKSELHSLVSLCAKSDRRISISALLSRLEQPGERKKILAAKLSQIADNPIFAERTDFDIGSILDGVYSINLSLLRSNVQRGELVRFVLKLIIGQMHKMGAAGSGTRRVIVLDEAWRLIRNSEEVGVLFREGRKYNISIIAATQLASDINNEVIANAGCLLIFRLQSEQDYKILGNAGIVEERLRERIGGLGMGGCMLYLVNKSCGSAPSRFFIERVSGMEFGTVHIHGGRMRMQISYSCFVQATEETVEAKLHHKIMSFVSDNGRQISVPAFVGFLGRLGLQRAGIVCYLRKLGIDDYTIVSAYDKA